MVGSTPLDVVDERAPDSIVLVGALIFVDSSVELRTCVVLVGRLATVDSRIELGGSIVLVGTSAVGDSSVELGETSLVVDSSEELVAIPVVVDSRLELGASWLFVDLMPVNVLETTVLDSCEEEDTSAFVLVCSPVEDWLVDGAWAVVFVVDEVTSGVVLVWGVVIASFVETSDDEVAWIPVDEMTWVDWISADEVAWIDLISVDEGSSVLVLV